jgi:hypothetical protein
MGWQDAVKVKPDLAGGNSLLFEEGTYLAEITGLFERKSKDPKRLGQVFLIAQFKVKDSTVETRPQGCVISKSFNITPGHQYLENTMGEIYSLVLSALGRPVTDESIVELQQLPELAELDGVRELVIGYDVRVIGSKNDRDYVETKWLPAELVDEDQEEPEERAKSSKTKR